MSAKKQDASAEALEDIRKLIDRTGKSFVLSAPEDDSDEFVQFYFIGSHKGKETVFDAALYTLRLEHESDIFEIAEARAVKEFPDFSKIIYEEDENGDLKVLDNVQEEVGLFMAEVIQELEETEAVKVQEHIEVDEDCDFGIGLDIGLNLERIDDKAIERFIKSYNAGTIQLDPTLYSFEVEDDS